MSLYERIDRDTTSRRKDTLEFFLIYVVCFAVMLIPIAVRRLGWRTVSARSTFQETRAMATNCAAASFMGM
jgi:hypothetical protein